MEDFATVADGNILTILRNQIRIGAYLVLVNLQVDFRLACIKLSYPGEIIVSEGKLAAHSFEPFWLESEKHHAEGKSIWSLWVGAM